MAIRKPKEMKNERDEAAEREYEKANETQGQKHEPVHRARHDNVSPLNDQAPPVGSDILPEGGPGPTNPNSNSSKTYPLKPHEELSDKKVKVDVEVSEDVVQVFKNNKDDIAKTAAGLLETHARRLGWL
jgi:hypothetical protein